MQFLFLINGVPVKDKNGQELQLTFELQSVEEQLGRVINNKKDEPDPTISALLPIFKNRESEVVAFIRKIDGASGTFITEEVNDLLRKEKITRAGCKTDLWRILTDQGYYRFSRSNWCRQVNA